MSSNPATWSSKPPLDAPATHTFESLYPLCGTGQNCLISGTGRDRKYRYRCGVDTPSGNYEIHEWDRLIEALIHRSGEDLLFQQLLEYESEHNPLYGRYADKRHHILTLHCTRIFDNPLWVEFIPFNQKYRPHILADTPQVTIIPDCCKTPGEVTLARYKNHSRDVLSNSPTLPCPICGRWSTFTLPPNPTQQT